MSRRSRSIAALALLLTSLQALAGDVAFPFNGDQFKSLFNAQTAQHGGDPIDSLKKKKSQLTAKFDDSRFKQDLKATGGDAKLATEMLLGINDSGMVDRIVVSGSRADPLNMARTIRTVSNLYEILNPGTSAQNEQDFISQLGLTRGDDDLTIGTPMGASSPGGEFTCSNRSLEYSATFGCVITPKVPNKN